MGRYSISPQVGDVCLMKQPSVPQWKWPLVKVVELISSTDGCIRKVKILTSTRMVLERAVCHLVRLEGAEH